MIILYIMLLLFPSICHAHTIIIDGDSLSDPTHTPSSIWPDELRIVRPDYLFLNASLNGKKVSTIVDEYEWIIHPYLGEFGNNYLILWGGTNDIFSGRSPEVIYEDLKLLWRLGKQDGFKVIVFTLYNLPGHESEVMQLNDLIRSDRSKYAYLIELDKMPEFNDPSFFLKDHVHLTEQGSQIIAREIIKDIK